MFNKTNTLEAIQGQLATIMAQLNEYGDMHTAEANRLMDEAMTHKNEQIKADILIDSLASIMDNGE